ncbi:MAG: AAA family ATPase [Planctomycetales bacterium]
MTELGGIAERLTRDVLEPMKRVFVGKDEIIDLLGIALVGGENLFLLGPPGTAKSAVVQELGRSMDCQVFDYLLTRFTEPNELFGPFDIRRLREGDLVTNIEGMLPEADFIFLDELLNANSAILNSLLMVLNERIFRRGRESIPVPALMVVGASNHLPEDEALRALFDRFLLRVQCDNVPTERLGEVLQAGWKWETGERPERGRISVPEILKLQRGLNTVDLSGALPTYIETIRRMRVTGIPVSDRRAVKLQRVVAASALLCGREAANVSDLWVLKHIWDTQEQRALLESLVNQMLATVEITEGDKPHRLAVQRERPNSEELAKDLELLEGELKKEVSATEKSVLRDKLNLIAGRCEWVLDPHQRKFLQEVVTRIWKGIEAA